MRPFIVCSLALLLAACASSSGTMTESIGIANAAIRTGNAGNNSVQDVQITTRAGLSTATIDAPPDRVWTLLPAVYAELGIPLSQTDPSLRILSAQNARILRIAGKRLSTYFSCGGTYGNNADSGNAYVSVRTQLLPASDGKTTARTEVRAAASGEGTTVGECGSTGLLEKTIAEAIQARATAAP